MFRARPVPMVVLAFVAGSVLAVAGQGGRFQRQSGPVTTRPMYKVGGTRDGMSAFPKVDYPQLKPLVAGQYDPNHYHGLDEANSLLKMWAEKYPDLVELYSVGKSFEGRDIWQITITNRKTGKDTVRTFWKRRCVALRGPPIFSLPASAGTCCSMFRKAARPFRPSRRSSMATP